MPPDFSIELISGLFKKLGTVATAVTALIGSGTASAKEGDVLNKLLERTTVASASEDPSRKRHLLKPLILKPGGSDMLLAKGGRSGSSHRSHSSHSSHRSHVSSSSGPRRGGGGGMGSSPDFEPSDSYVPESKPRYTAPPAPKQQIVKPQEPTKPPVEDLTPEKRFRLVAIERNGDTIKAVIRDEKSGTSKSYEVGDKLDEFTLDEINLKQRMIVLFGRKEDRILIGQR